MRNKEVQSIKEVDFSGLTMPGASFGVLTKESFWKKFFEVEVNGEGNEIECVS